MIKRNVILLTMCLAIVGCGTKKENKESVMEEEIRSSVISYFLMDFAPKTLSIFIDFFPSLEVIVESNDELKKIDV